MKKHKGGASQISYHLWDTDQDYFRWLYHHCVPFCIHHWRQDLHYFCNDRKTL